MVSCSIFVRNRTVRVVTTNEVNISRLSPTKLKVVFPECTYIVNRKIDCHKSLLQCQQSETFSTQIIRIDVPGLRS